MARHIVNFSGGAGSFAAAARVVEKYGPDDVSLLTADTLSEAADWRPFIEAAAEHLQAELIVLCDGRDIWELAADEGAIPGNHMGFCSRILKRELLDEWREKHCDPEDTICYFGFDWTEDHRLQRVRVNAAPWRCEAPLMWKPILSKQEAMRMIHDAKLPFPRAYDLGLPHNNCLKFGCVKGGQAYWQQIYHQAPDVFARAESEEQGMRDRIGDHAMMRESRYGKKRPLPLSVLRERIEQQPSLLDQSDWGSCACFVD